MMAISVVTYASEYAGNESIRWEKDTVVRGDILEACKLYTLSLYRIKYSDKRNLCSHLKRKPRNRLAM